MRGITRMTALAAVVLASIGATALPAVAQNVICDDDVIVGQTITGTLVVPAETSCVLDDVEVVGDITVGIEADLFATDVTVTGSVTVDPDAFVDFVSSEIQGDLDGLVPFGTVLENSTLGGDLSSSLSLLALVIDSDVEGDVRLIGGPRGFTDVFLETARISGDVTADRSEIADVINSTIEGSVDILRARDGSIVCENEIDGNVRLANGAGLIDIGSGFGCEVNYFGGDVTIQNQSGTPTIDNTIIRGDLVCTGNGGVEGNNNRVRGEATGQCDGVTGASQSFGIMSRSAQQSEQDVRREKALELRESRRDTGEVKLGSASIAQADEVAVEVVEEVLEERREDIAEMRGGETPHKPAKEPVADVKDDVAKEPENVRDTSARDAAQDRARSGRGR